MLCISVVFKQESHEPEFGLFHPTNSKVSDQFHNHGWLISVLRFFYQLLHPRQLQCEQHPLIWQAQIV